MSSLDEKEYQKALIQLEDYVVKISHLRTMQETNMNMAQSDLLKLNKTSPFFWNKKKKERKTQELMTKINHAEDNVVMIDRIMDNMAQYNFNEYNVSTVNQFITRLRDLCLLNKMNNSRQHLRG